MVYINKGGYDRLCSMHDLSCVIDGIRDSANQYSLELTRSVGCGNGFLRVDNNWLNYPYH